MLQEWRAPPGCGTNLGSRPTKALDDAVYSAAQLLHDRDRGRRKIMLVISDGINGREFNSHSYQETLTALLNEISPSTAWPWAHILPPEIRQAVRLRQQFWRDISYAARARLWKSFIHRLQNKQTRIHPGLCAAWKQSHFYLPRGGSTHDTRRTPCQDRQATTRPPQRVLQRSDRPGGRVAL